MSNESFSHVNIQLSHLLELQQVSFPRQNVLDNTLLSHNELRKFCCEMKGLGVTVTPHK